jgi:hypothetical protein
MTIETADKEQERIYLITATIRKHTDSEQLAKLRNPLSRSQMIACCGIPGCGNSPKEIGG